jgi:hypothetical protein
MTSEQALVSRDNKGKKGGALLPSLCDTLDNKYFMSSFTEVHIQKLNILLRMMLHFVLN